MSPEAQVSAIVEACPKLAFMRDGKAYWRDVWREQANEDSMARLEFEPLDDLNAMHEAEKGLMYEQQPAFLWELKKIIMRTSDTQGAGEFDVCHATAAQRAEAFLKTIGKWDDTK